MGRRTVGSCLLLLVGITAVLVGGVAAIGGTPVADAAMSNTATADSDIEADSSGLELIYTASTDGTVVATTPDGGEAWEFDAAADSVLTVTAGPDGDRVFAGGDNESVAVLDPESGELDDEYTHPERDVTDITVDPGGDTVYTAVDGTSITEGTFDAVDVENGTVTWSVERSNGFTAAAIAPDGDTVYSGHESGDVRAHDPADGDVEWEVEHRDEVTDMVVHPDSDIVYTASEDELVRAIDADSGTVEWAYDGIDTGVAGLTISADGQLLFAGGGDQVHAIDADAGVSHLETGPTDDITDVAIDPDREELAVSRSDGDVISLGPDTGDILSVQSPHEGAITDVAYAGEPTPEETGTVEGTVTDDEDDPIADARVLLYDDPAETPVASTTTDDTGAYALEAPVDSYTLEATAWQRENTTAITVAEDEVTTAALELDGLADAQTELLYAASSDETVDALDAADLGDGPVDRWTFAGHTDSVQAVAVSPDGEHVFTGSDDRTVRLVDADSGVQRAEYRHPDRDVADIVADPDGETIYTAVDGTSVTEGTFDAVDVETGTVTWSVERSGGFTAGAVAADGDAVYSGHERGELRAHDPDDGDIDWDVDHRDAVTNIVVHPDGDTVYTASEDELVRAIDADSGTVEWAYAGLDTSVTALESSADGQLLFAGGSDEVHAIDAEAGIDHWETDVADDVTDLVSDPDRTDLVVGLVDGSVQRLDPADGDPSTPSSVHESSVTDLADDGAATPTDTGIAQGTVTDDEDDPIENARLFLFDESAEAPIASTTTDESGAYELEAPVGSYTLEATAWQRDAETAVSIETNESTAESLVIEGIAAAQSDLLYSASVADTAGAFEADPETAALTDRWTFTGHTDSVQAVAVSPDREQVFTGGDDRTVRLVDADSGVQRDEYRHPDRDVTDIVADPGGETIYTAVDGTSITEGTFDAVDIETGSVSWSVERSNGFTAGAVPADGEAVYSGHEDGQLRAHDPADGGVDWEVEHRDAVTDIVVHPDGDTVYTTSDDELVRAIDADSGTIEWASGGLDTGVSALELSADGTLLFAAGGDGVHAIDASAGVGYWETTVANDVGDLVVDPDRETLLVGLTNGDTEHVSPADGTTTETTGSHEAAITDLAYDGEPTPEDTGSIEGTVTDGEGDPIENARVRLEDESAAVPVVSTTTDGDGAYDLEAPVGNYTLDATAWQRNTTTSVTVGDDDPTELSIDGIDSAQSDLLYSASSDETLNATETDVDAREFTDRWTFAGHTDSVQAVTASPDGEHVFTGGDDRTVRLVDADTGVQRGEYRHPERDVTDLAVDADGTFLYTAVDGTSITDGTLDAVDIDSGTVLWSDERSNGFTAVAVDPDDAVYSGHEDGQLRAHDPVSGDVDWTVDHRDEVTGIAIHPDGDRVYTASEDELVRAIDAETGSVEWAYGGLGTDATALEISADGHLLFAGGGDAVHAVDASAGVGYWETTVEHSVSELLVDPTRELLVAGLTDGDRQLVDPASGATGSETTAHDGSVTDVAYVGDEPSVDTGTVEGVVTDDNGDPIENARVALFDDTGDTPVAATTTDEQGVYEIDLAVGNYTLEATAWQRMATTTVTVTADTSTTAALEIGGLQGGQTGLLYSASADGTVGSFDATTLGPDTVDRWSFAGHTDDVQTVAVTPDGDRVVTGGDDRTVRLLDADSGVQVDEYSHPDRDVTDLAVDPDGETIYTAVDGTSITDGTLDAVDVDSGTVVWSDDRSNGFTTVAVPSDGDVVYSGHEDGQLRAHDSSDGDVDWEVDAEDELTAIAIDPAGELVYAGSEDGVVRAVDTESGDVEWTIELDALADVIVSTDGDTVYAAGDESVTALDTETEAIDWSTSIDRTVTDLAIDADDETVIAGRSDGEYVLVDTETENTTVGEAIHDSTIGDLTVVGSTDGPIEPNLTMTPEPAVVDRPVTLDASTTDGEIVEYQWAFGDGTTEQTTNRTTTHSYDEAGTYAVELTAVDETGATATTTAFAVVEDSVSTLTTEFDEVPESATAGESVTATVTVENEGNVAGTDTVALEVANETVDTAEIESLDPNATETATLEWETTADDAGETIELTATTSDDAVSTAVALNEPTGATFAATIDETNSPVAEGEDLVVNTTVENVGEQAGETDVEFQFDGESQETRTIDLDPSENRSLSFTLNTTDTDPGVYDVTITAGNDTDIETVTIDDTTGAAFTADLVDTPETIDAGETATVNATVQNEGDETAADTVTLTAGNETVDTVETDEIQPGDAVSVALSWDTDADDVGTTTLELATSDDAVETDVTVDAPAAPTFDVTIDETNSPIAEDEDLLVNTTVENVGEAAGETDVAVAFDGDVQNTTPVELDSSENRSLSVALDTTDVDPGAYDVTVTAGEDNATETVTIDEPTAATFAAEFEAVPEVVTAGDLVTANVTIENQGDAAGDDTVALSVANDTVDTAEIESLEPNATETVTLEWVTSEDDAGETIDLTATTSDDAVSTDVTFEELTVAFNVTIAETNSPIEEGKDLLVNTTVENVDEAAGTETVSLAIGDQEVANETVDLDAGAETTIDFAWTADDIGEFNATVETPTATATEPVTIEEPPRLPVTIDETTAPVEIGDELVVNATVDNVANESTETTVEADLDGEVSANETIELDAGSNATVSVALETGDLDAGNATLTLSTADDTVETVVELEAESDDDGGGGGGLPAPPSDPPDDDPAIVDVKSIDVPDAVDAGDSFTVEVTVENVGESTSTEPVTITADNETVDTESATLVASESRTVSTTIEVDDDAAGTIAVGAETGDDAATEMVTVDAVESSVTLDDVDFPADAESGASVTAVVTVENDGDIAITETIEYEIDGELVGTETVSLDPGEEETAYLDGTVPEDSSGPSVEQQVTVADESDSGTLALIDSSDGTPGFGVLVGAIALALVAARARR